MQSERSGFAWILQYGENIRGTVRYVLEEGASEMEKGYASGLAAEVVERPLTCCEFRRLSRFLQLSSELYQRAPDEGGGACGGGGLTAGWKPPCQG